MYVGVEALENTTKVRMRPGRFPAFCGVFESNIALLTEWDGNTEQYKHTEGYTGQHTAVGQRHVGWQAEKVLNARDMYPPRRNRHVDGPLSGNSVRMQLCV